MGVGLAVAVAVAAPVVVVARVAAGEGATGASTALAAASLLAAVAGGVVTGRRERGWPILNAALTGAGLYVVVRVLWAALGGSVPNVLSLILVTMMYASVGAVGGAIGSMRKVGDR
ncbi:MAG: hypothetical protein WHS89_00310 [Acidimicrobiales bacterium]